MPIPSFSNLEIIESVASSKERPSINELFCNSKFSLSTKASFDMSFPLKILGISISKYFAKS